MKVFHRVWIGSVALGLAIGVLGCKRENRLIERVSVQPSTNLEVIRIALEFNKRNVQATFAGGFPIKNYGYLFINPFTGQQPFEVGFDLNTAIVNDQDYVRLTPTTVLPNGVPIGLPYAIVEVKGVSPINPNFDAYAYIDVLHKSWLGAAGIFSFINDRFFPSGLAFTQVFMRDDQGRPGVLASVFGPELHPDGTLKRAGGIAVLANVKQLLQRQKAMGLSRTQSFDLIAEPGIYLQGPAAKAWKGRTNEIRRIESQIIQGLNRL